MRRQFVTTISGLLSKRDKEGAEHNKLMVASRICGQDCRDIDVLYWHKCKGFQCQCK